MPTEPAATSAGAHLSESQIRAILSQVIDPEIGVDIVALGLVYRIVVAPEQLLIDMTMTSPACPMGEMILDDVHAVLAESLPDSLQPQVNLVWAPAWNPSMMSETTKQHFGWTPET
ncbi:MAG: metal-sulfur cluster assembly factor [Burkholderiales bacterium]|nr:metal-sulfur cluster assembly factor [Burkholderiales bacterium]